MDSYFAADRPSLAAAGAVHKDSQIWRNLGAIDDDFSAAQSVV
jgi:hypothetical protein